VAQAVQDHPAAQVPRREHDAPPGTMSAYDLTWREGESADDRRRRLNTERKRVQRSKPAYKKKAAKRRRTAQAWRDANRETARAIWRKAAEKARRKKGIPVRKKGGRKVSAAAARRAPIALELVWR
jgi:hypothetical protein